MRTAINLRALQATIDQILADPARGAITWRASVAWAGGLRAEAKCRQFDLAFDEPPTVAGGDSAPSPHEVVLACYGACLVVSYALNAARLGIPLEDVRVEVEGHVDIPGFLGVAGVPTLKDLPGYKQVHARVFVRSEAEPALLEQLHQQTVAFSPVGLTLSRPVKVEADLIIE
ncbi:MAG TPA: OsmC family protein [Anaerolineales bacterium]|nr:OsmC family protein [Anaerolineales bacterium]